MHLASASLRAGSRGTADLEARKGKTRDIDKASGTRTEKLGTLRALWRLAEDERLVVGRIARSIIKIYLVALGRMTALNTVLH